MRMPGAPAPEESWEPIEEGPRAPSYFQRDMSAAAPPRPTANPFDQFMGDQEPAQKIERSRSLWDRFRNDISGAMRGGTVGVLENLGYMGMRDPKAALMRAGSYPAMLLNPAVGYHMRKVSDRMLDASPETPEAAAYKEKLAYQEAQYQDVPPAETTLEFMVGVSGHLAGGALDPINVAPWMRFASPALRATNPMLSSILDQSTSNALLNTTLNVALQDAELAADRRDSFSPWETMTQTAIGALLGVPFGYAHGVKEQRFLEEQALTQAFNQAPEPGKAPMGPRRSAKPTQNIPKIIPSDARGPATAESVRALADPETIGQAQEQLFGEVKGTRNLSPEELTQLEDHLLADTPVEGQARPQYEGARPAAVAPSEPVEKINTPSETVAIGRDYQEFDPDELLIDAKRFQFKEGGDESGVTERLKGVKKWDQTKAGVTLIWESKDGKRYVADGHQRLGLAKKMKGEGQKPKILGLVLRETNGISAEDARVIAAAKNVAEGTGSAIDAAKIIRTRPEIGVDLPPTSALVRDAKGLAKLSDDAFGMVINKRVPAGYAAIVGELAPDQATHPQLLGLLAKNEPANSIEAESIVRDALEAPAVQETMNDMFGGTATQILFKERAQVLSAAASAIRKDRQAFATLVREEDRIAGAGNVLATATNKDRAQQDAALLHTLQTLARRKGPVADALAQAAKSLKEGGNRQAVVRDFIGALRSAAQGPGAGGRGGGAPGQPGQIAARPVTRNTQTPAFRKWFGDSKVVDADGEPMVLYHGSPSTNIEAFRPELNRGQRYSSFRGSYFTPNSGLAGMYAGGEQGAGATYPVFLKIENPLYVTRADDTATFSSSAIFRDEAIRLQRMGYDGVINLEREEYVVFQPTQIKSVFNRGTFDAADPDIAHRAFHGSPHDFQRFDISRIGSGEGAQAFGYGLYFAGNRKTAEVYRDSVYDMAKVTRINERLAAIAKELDQYRVPGSSQYKDPRGQALKAEYDRLMDEKLQKGHLYEVDIKGKEEEFLNLDQPLSRQTPEVREALRKLAGKVPKVQLFTPEPERTFRGVLIDILTGKDKSDFRDGHDLLGLIAGRLNPKDRKAGHVKAAELLREVGIPGLRYFDDKSRKVLSKPAVEKNIREAQDMLLILKRDAIGNLGATRIAEVKKELDRLKKYLAEIEALKDPTSNYVVFDDKLIAVMKKDDRPVEEEAIAFRTEEPGADGKPQMVLPGAEKKPGGLAQLKADAPLKPKVAQKPADFGLFGDEKQQEEFAFALREDADYVDLTPSGRSREASIGGVSIVYGVDGEEVSIISVRTPVELRRQGWGRAAMLAFLERVDEQGMAVRAFSTPLDRMTDQEGAIRFFESLGFSSTGRAVDLEGNIEMLRAGPPPELAELRQLTAEGRMLTVKDYPLADRAVLKNTYIESQPARSLDEIYADVGERNDSLIRAGDAIAEELGVEFRIGPVKLRQTAEEKLARKGYRSTSQITDIVRGVFLIETPDLAQRAVNMLARNFRVMDEGWNITGEKYLDRKVLIQWPDGMIGEIQITAPEIWAAKYPEGDKLYRVSRDPKIPEDARLAAAAAQQKLYGDVLASMPPEWARVLGRSGASGKASSIEVTGYPELRTSEKLTSVHSSPGDSTAQALAPSTTAGRPSQSNARMGKEDIAARARPQPPGGNVPTNRSQSGVRGQGPALRLEDIGEALSRAVGAPVRQGRLHRGPPGQKPIGQYDRKQGVIRLREMSDFETRTHESAHALETEYGRTLQALKQAHNTELEPLAYPGAAQKQVLSEGFAEWFRFYITTPNYARRNAPAFTQAFEQFLEANNPEQLAAFTQAQADFATWTRTPSAAVVSADVVSSRRRNSISEAVSRARREGWQTVLGEYADKAYTAIIDKAHPIHRITEELRKVYEARTGQPLDLKASANPYVLARMMADAYSPGHIDALHGVVPYHGTLSEGPGLADALSIALGDQWRRWDDGLMADFAAYLISRRAIHEYARFHAGEIPNPPTKFTEGDHRVTVDELGAAHPEWAQAADMIYEWNRNLLKKKFEAGFLSEATYIELNARPDYVPMQRDLSDIEVEPSVPAGQAGRTLRSAILKAFKGSKRSVINPIESMMKDAYETNALILQNEIVKVLDDLAQAAGPGSGKFAERIPAKQMRGTEVNIEEALRQAAKDAGLNPQDIDQLTQHVDLLIGADAKATIFRMGEINEKGEPIVYGWRNGQRFALRLADGDMGRAVYDAMTGLSKEGRNMFVSILSLPTTALRYGITTAPHFVLANYVRDQVSAWVLTGNGFIPFISGARGVTDELIQTEITRTYNSFWGLMGGANVAALDKGRARRDIAALNKRGYAVKRFASWRGLAELTEISETGTRLAVFRNAFRRAKGDGLSDYEAAVEAAYTARDYIDFGRHGSHMLAARRLVTFLNASLQGLDKTVRVLTGEGSLRKAIAPYVLWKNKRPLSRTDKENLGKAAIAWTKVTAIGLFGLGLSYVYKDDPEHEEISDYLRATHWMVKRGPGDWVAIPKPFELGFVSNLFERSFEAIYKRNPVAMQKFIAGLFDVTMPPTEVPVVQTAYEIWANKKKEGGPITPEHLMGLDPAERYTGYTSELSKRLGRELNIAPTVLDHAIQGFGGSWGKIVMDSSTDRANEKTPLETIGNSVANRFLRDNVRGSTSTRQFWDMISQSAGRLSQVANTYKNALDNAAEGQAARYLEGKPDNEVAYALLEGHFEAEAKRLHPMRRARDAIGAVSQVRREIAVRRLESKEDGTPILLTPSERQMSQELLGKLEMVEARNALIVIGEPGWAQKKLMDRESLLKDIATALPNVAEELAQRFEKAKVYDFEAVAESWPEVKERLLLDREEASFDDLIAGAR